MYGSCLVKWETKYFVGKTTVIHSNPGMSGIKQLFNNATDPNMQRTESGRCACNGTNLIITMHRRNHAEVFAAKENALGKPSQKTKPTTMHCETISHTITPNK
jgi:hypothetical protein